MSKMSQNVNFLPLALDEQSWINRDVAGTDNWTWDTNSRQVLPGGGEGDILARIIQPTAHIDQQNNITKVLPHFGIPFKFFTLQDAIDFAIFAVRSTIDAIRFQPRPKTVGGPIDVLVIKPEEAFWVQRKKLKGI